MDWTTVSRYGGGCIPNKAGIEEDRDKTGRSMVIHPMGGEILVTGSPDREEVVAAEIDLDEVSEAKRRIPYWRDRRPSLYGDLLE
jgi:predicted amidohydrolase